MWECSKAIHLQQPEILIAYTLRYNLANHKDWEWTQEYAKQSEHKAKLTMALKVVVEQGRKYKLGIKVPQSITHALYIDCLNGNHLWQEAIKSKLKQINDYKTFQKLRNGETVSDYT